MLNILPWKRYWSERTAKIDLSDGGNLSDPETNYGHFVNSELAPFAELTTKQCLVLLGEPGIGKTKTLRLESGATDGRELVDYVDLRAYGDERRLVERLFESPQFRRWEKSGERLHLFLDSLDECLLRVDTVAALLPEEFRKHPVDRLWIRIACRTAVWPVILEEELKKLWREEQIGVFELAPLRRRDVEQAAIASGIDKEVFIRAVERAEAVPLAIKPVTLSMLLDVYSRERGLPGNRWDLYEKGCRVLAEETNESRLASQRKGKLTAKQRIAVASRVAAVTLIANRYAVWAAPDLGNVPSDDVTLSELIGGTEPAGTDALAVDRGALDETLDTGLFTSRGLRRMGWSHQTYAEFLAAYYLTQHRLTLSQILSLIRHPSGKLVPQLHELSAWLATKRGDVFNEILSSDPEVLVRSDVANAEETARSKLMASFLAAVDSEKLHDMSFDLVRHYRKLAHRGLSEQLKPYIEDRRKGVVVRRVAMLMARECREKALAEDLLNVALDDGDDEHARSLAIAAFAECSDEHERAALRALVLPPSGASTPDEVKGHALELLWPRHLTAAELFAALTRSKRPEVVGAYRTFIASHAATHLGPDDLPDALTWVKELERGASPEAFTRDYEMASLADQIVIAAIENLEHTRVRSALPSVLMQRLRHYYRCAYPHHNEKFEAALARDADCRHALIEGLASEMSLDRRDAILVSPILMRQDLPWLIGQALRHSETDEARAHIFALLAGAVSIDTNDRRVFETIYEASHASSLISNQFAWMLAPVELGSEKAAQLKQQYEATRPRALSAPKIDPPVNERILDCLTEFEAGKREAWWHLNFWMIFEPDGGNLGELQADLTKTPGWRDADELTRTRIIHAAEGFLRAGTPSNDRWLGTATWHRPASSGYRAVRLLLTERPSALTGLQPQFWGRWAAAIVAYPSERELPIQQKLVGLTYAQAPDDLMQALQVLTSRAIAKGESASLAIELEKLSACPADDRLKSALLAMLNDPALAPEQIGPILRDLLRRNIKESAEFALSWLRPPLATDEMGRKKALVAARELLSAPEPSCWGAIWKAIESDDSFGVTLLLDFAQQAWLPTPGGILSKLAERELANLFLWLEHHVPRVADADHRAQAHAIGPDEPIGYLRDAVLQILQGRGTTGAVHELQWLTSELPQHKWLYTVALNARNEMLRRTWLPPLPAEVLAIARSADNRLIETPNQLLDVLVETLERLQLKDLRGETGRAKFLWNVTREDKLRPKDEPSLSDYIKGFLEQDLKGSGVIVNREVEVYRPPRRGKGPATDIHVDVITKAKDPLHLKAVIEVKGCWHANLKTALKAQLIDKYLQGPDCQNGIYLVVWFDRESWDDRDKSRDSVPDWSIQQAREFFTHQASQYSKGDLLVRAYVLDATLGRPN